MEPLAPGTEDEPLMINFSSSTKQEKERERLLNIKAVLPSGFYGKVFEFKYINGTEHWYCNACSCPVMGWVFHHEAGKRHTTALGANQTSDSMQSSSPQEESPAMQIAPGEPVPPGFEGQIEKLALIQERLDVFTAGPLVALEYLLELRDYDITKEPNYLCLLCDKKGDPRTVLTHLASYRHITQYLQKHFPTCYRALAPYMTKQYKRNWQVALHGIAEAIEKKFGRLKPLPVDADKYEKDPVHYIELIAKGRHFSELSGYTFEEYVNREELTRVYEDTVQDDVDKYSFNKANLPQSAPRKKSPSPPVVENPIKRMKTGAAASATRRRSLSSVSSISSSDMSDFESKAKKLEPVGGERKKSRSKSPFKRRGRSPFTRRNERRSPPRNVPYHRRDNRRSRSRSRSRERNLLPWEKSNYRRTKPEPLTSKTRVDKTEEFKKLCKAIDNDMERVLKNHKKNPEKHPQYNEEWKQFWNKRYKELQSEGKDAAKHDFKPEWIEFWNKRMIELHQDEVKTKKDALKKRLGLPEEPAPISFKILGKKKAEPGKMNKPVPPSAMPDQDPEVIVIEDKDDDRKRSHSPWEEDSKSRDSRERPLSRIDRRSRDRERSRDPLPRRPSSRDRQSSRDRSPRDSLPRRPSSRDRQSSRDRSPRDRSPRYDRDRPDYKSKERPDYRQKEYPPKEYSKEYRRGERIRIVSELPWERDRKMAPYHKNEVPSYYRPPAVMRDVTRAPVLSPPHKGEEPEEEEDVEINVVAVLRLLTALEEKLGSLGPKVIDLLAQALAMEKNEANSSDVLLDNEVNCVMFETVKEKLKGLLLAGFVEPIQEKAFKNAIKKTASLIHLAGERKKEREKLLPKLDPVKVPGVGTVDKAAIARQIANALVLQGKTDVTQAELEQLINAVVGMAEASRGASKPITTANFLEQITKGGAKEKSSPPPKEVVKVEQPVVVAEVKPEKPISKDMEGLSDSDLQTLLQNFKDLSTEEQHGLINYLKKLEAREPDRVERLRKFVNLGGNKETKTEEKKEKNDRESPFSNRMGSINPTVEEPAKKVEEKPPTKIEEVTLPIDSDEEDYTFEDVVKAASKNVKEKEMEKKREIVEETMRFEMKKSEMNLEDTRALISNIMSNVNKKDPAQGNLLGFGQVNSIDFAKTLNSIPVNLANLANIVGSVQNMGMQQAAGSFGQSQFQNLSFQRTNVGYPQVRPNVTYPLDKNKVAYPNYGAYGQGQNQPGPPEQRQPQFPPTNQFGSGANRSNFSNNRW